MKQILRDRRCKALWISFLILSSTLLFAQQKPIEFFGFEPGSDRELFTYEELISYLQDLDAASDRLTMVEIGKSPLGRTMYIAFLSSSGNLSRLDEFKAINKRLALDPDIPDGELETKKYNCHYRDKFLRSVGKKYGYQQTDKHKR